MVDYILTLATVYPAYAAIVAFVLGFLTDIVWARWAISTKLNKAFAAANFTIFIYLFGLIYTLFIIEKNLLLVGMYILGGWIGTYLAVKKGHK
jgi:hypothetical protein